MPEQQNQPVQFSHFELFFKYANRNQYFVWAICAFIVAAIWSFPCLLLVSTSSGSSLLGFFGVLLTFIPGALLVECGRQDILGKIHLIAEGQPTLGVISDVTIGRHKGRRWIECLAYSYWVEQSWQEPLHCKAEARNPPYRPGEIETGAIVLVLYDPENPGRSEIDRFDVRRCDRLRLTEKLRAKGWQAFSWSR